MKREPKLPTAEYPGGLTDVEHAIVEARKWQFAHMESTPQGAPINDAYTVIVGLLGTFPYETLMRAYKKGGVE